MFWASQAFSLGLPERLFKASGTEAGLFQQAGIPSIICGPGNIAQAHKPNKYVTFEQIAQCELFIDQLATQLNTFP